jgi:hypothetical protein
MDTPTIGITIAVIILILMPILANLKDDDDLHSGGLHP